MYICYDRFTYPYSCMAMLQFSQPGLGFHSRVARRRGVLLDEGSLNLSKYYFPQELDIGLCVESMGRWMEVKLHHRKRPPKHHGRNRVFGFHQYEYESVFVLELLAWLSNCTAWFFQMSGEVNYVMVLLS